jgi:hypothetical protein
MRTISLATVLTLAASAAFAQSASFETQGFPLSPVQTQVLAGLKNIVETPAWPTSPEMSANRVATSPVLMMVLAPRPHDDQATPTDVGFHSTTD